MNRKWLWGIFCAITILVVFAATINVMASQKNEEVLKVKTEKVKQEKLSFTTLASGIVQPSHEEKIYLDSTKGVVADIKVKEGQTVKEGEELFVYESEELSLQLSQHDLARKRILIQLEEQNEKLKRLKKEIDQAKKDKLPDETIKQLELEKQSLEYQNRTSNLDYQETLMQIENIEEQKKDLTVKSSISGIIKGVNDPKLINNQSQTPFIHITSQDQYQIKGTITEYDFNYLNVGQAVTIIPKAIQNESIEGTIQKISNSPVEQTETINSSSESVTSYPFIVVPNNKVDILQNGYHVSIEIELQSEKASLMVPEKSLKIIDGKSFVFTIENGVVSLKEIVTGATHDGWKEVVSGLKQGEVVATNQLNQLSNNMEVQIDD